MEEDSIVVRKIPTLPGNYGKFYENIYGVLMNKAELLVKPAEAVGSIFDYEAQTI